MTDPESIAQEFFYESPAMKPTLRTWIKHILLLGLTFCTATIAGTLFPFGRGGGLMSEEIPDPQNASELVQLLMTLPLRYGVMISDAVRDLFTKPGYFIDGISFSLSLLFILICHEMGHYIACRLYKVDATLPFFLPTPPMIGPAGTFGAFIKILSPMPSRRAVFDIGVAGPIAGFIALVPIAIMGIWTMQPATAQELTNQSGLTFANPFFLKSLGWFFGHDPLVYSKGPFYYAAWVGLLVTALNLIPSGQLDGGHAIYAVFGETVHKWTGRIAFPVMAILSVLGMYFYSSPSGFLIAIILAVMMRIRHPRPWDQTPLDTKRKVIAFLTLVIFTLCFVPFPIQIN
ncbi:MAG: site-2 protease family protein [Acidobacteriota bacterium]